MGGKYCIDAELLTATSIKVNESFSNMKRTQKLEPFFIQQKFPEV